MPRFGVRSTISRIIPASFRHGTITETESSRPDGAGRGRATTHHVSDRCESGQTLATIPLRKVETSGICFGKRIRRAVEITSKPASSRRLVRSAGVTQLRIGLRGFRCRRSAMRINGRQSWL